MARIGLFYGSTNGNTEEIAYEIQKGLDGEGNVAVINIADSQDFGSYDYLILGTSTWGFGDLQDDWGSETAALEMANLAGKKVAFFGLGDQDAYPETYQDGMGILYQIAKECGAEVVGQCPAEGHEFDESKAVVGGQFVGLALDNDNQPKNNADRLNAWINQLKTAFNIDS